MNLSSREVIVIWKYLVPRKDTERGQAKTECALGMVLVGGVCIVILFWVGAGAARVFERVVCVVDQSRCPVGPVHSGDRRCTSEEQVTLDYVRCVGSTLEISLSSNCPNTAMQIGGTPGTGEFSYNPYTNRHTYSEPGSAYCPTPSTIPARQIVSNRANGASAANSSPIPVS